MNAHEFINTISDHVCGYREAPEEDILNRVKFLIWLEKNYNMQRKVDELRIAIDDLYELSQEIQDEHNIQIKTQP